MIGYPTVILFTPEGEEIDRKIGFGGDAEGFVNDLKDWTQGVNTLKNLLSDAEQHPEDVTVLHSLAIKYNQRYEQALAVPHYQKILELDPENAYGLHQEARFYIAMNVLESQGDPALLEDFLSALSGAESFYMRGKQGLIRYYDREGSSDRVVGIYEELLESQPEDTGLKNAYAWYIFEERVSNKYDVAIAAARKAVELDPAADQIWDTLAQLLYINGEIEEAVGAMEKALSLSPEDSYYKGELERFLKGE